MNHIGLHERDQRRHDKGRHRQKQRRQLVAERLASPCRHHGQGWFSGHDTAHDFGLARPQMPKMKFLAQELGNSGPPGGGRKMARLTHGSPRRGEWIVAVVGELRSQIERKTM